MRDILLTGLMAYSAYSNYQQTKGIDSLTNKVSNLAITPEIVNDMCTTIDKLRGREFKIDSMDMKKILAIAKKEGIIDPKFNEVIIEDLKDISEVNVENQSIEAIVKLYYVEDINWPRESNKLKYLKGITLYDEKGDPIINSYITINRDYLEIGMLNSYLNIFEKGNDIYNILLKLNDREILELEINLNEEYLLFDNAIDHFKSIIKKDLPRIIKYSSRDPEISNLLYYTGSIRSICPNIIRHNTYIIVKDLNNKEYQFEIEENSELFLIPISGLGKFIETRRVFKIDNNSYGLEFTGINKYNNRVVTADKKEYRDVCLVEVTLNEIEERS